MRNRSQSNWFIVSIGRAQVFPFQSRFKFHILRQVYLDELLLLLVSEFHLFATLVALVILVIFGIFSVGGVTEPSLDPLHHLCKGILKHLQCRCVFIGRGGPLKKIKANFSA